MSPTRKVHYNTTAPRNPRVFLMCRNSWSGKYVTLSFTRVEKDVTCKICLKRMEEEGIL